MPGSLTVPGLKKAEILSSPVPLAPVRLTSSAPLVMPPAEKDLKGRSFRVNRLLTDLAIGRGDGSYNRLLNDLKKPDLLILDDFGVSSLDPSACRDLLEVVDAGPWPDKIRMLAGYCKNGVRIFRECLAG